MKEFMANVLISFGHWKYTSTIYHVLCFTETHTHTHSNLTINKWNVAKITIGPPRCGTWCEEGKGMLGWHLANLPKYETSRVSSFFPLVSPIWLVSSVSHGSVQGGTRKTSRGSIESASRVEFSWRGTDRETNREIRIERCIDVLDLRTLALYRGHYKRCRLLLFTSSAITILSSLIVTSRCRRTREYAFLYFILIRNAYILEESLKREDAYMKRCDRNTSCLYGYYYVDIISWCSHVRIILNDNQHINYPMNNSIYVWDKYRIYALLW